MRRLHRYAAAFAALVFTAGVAASEPALDHCVDIVQPAKSGRVAAKTVGSANDVGNVTVMEFTGDYSRGQFAAREEVAQRFYAEHPDAYDFLIVFTTFEFDTGTATAFNNRVKNDVAGIGQPQYDHGAGYGSAGRLQSYIDMAAMSRYTFNAREPNYETTLNVLAHELMHQWGANVAYRDGDGANSAALLGQDSAHWSYFLDSDASVMYGSDWQRRPDGRYEAVAVRRRFSPLDLYLAGFAAASEVLPMTLIRSGDGDASALPRLGAITGGLGETVTIEQIVAANGARAPSAADAPKSFRAAMVLLTRHGETASPQLLQSLEALRVRFQQRFAQMTGGRAHIRIFTESNKDDRPALPTILRGSDATNVPPGYAAAVAWLEARQAADGHWEDRPATALRDTVAAMRALEELAPQSPAIPRARQWIAGRTVASLDARAWQLAGTQANEHAAALIAAQAGDGGWGLADGFATNPLDTATVAGALAQNVPDDAAVAQALAYLAPQQNADGSFGATSGGRGRILPTLRAARLLQASNAAQHAAAAQRAGEWLDTRRRVGGFGDLPQISLADTIDVYAQAGLVPLSAASATTARTATQANQGTAGDWGGSVYLTATAALASARDLRVNFAAAEPPRATPAVPADGDRVALVATVVNAGSIAAPASVLRWYDGDPAQGGTPIGADVAVPVLAPGARKNTQVEWDTTGRAGAHALRVVFDADAAVVESREDDNIATLDVVVGPAPVGADLQVLASDLTLDPALIGSLPQTVRLTGIVRNSGSVAVAGARVVLTAVSTPGAVLAETTLDVPARGSTPIDLAFNITDVAQLQLALRADPDGAIAEAREDNNEARLALGLGPSLDLAIMPDDLSVTGPVVAGRDATVRVTVRNRGTIAAPPASLRVEVVQGAATYALFDGNVDVPAGGSVVRVLPWRTAAAGPALVRAVVDGADQIAEADETNNAAQVDVDVVTADRPELAAVASTLAFTPTPALQGDPLTASLRIRNDGAAVTAPFAVALFAGDPRVGAPRIGATIVAGLAAGADTVVAINIGSVEFHDDVVLFVEVDADAAIDESDETNNVAIKPLAVVGLPDPAATLASIALTPTMPVAQDAVVARVTVRNLGERDAQDVKVRLFEVDGEANATALGDRTIALLPAGGSAQVEWQWTLGAQARAVTVVIDPDGALRELSKDNNRATLPFDVQSGALFASERYFSPNGDGVRDETALVFRVDAGTSGDVAIANGLGFVVRRYAQVAVNANGRAQVVWDGRDERGRVVPDGDYRATVTAADGTTIGEVPVTVDNNRSSVLEAIGDGRALTTPSHFSNWQVPPAGSANANWLYGKRDVYAIERVNPIASMPLAVISSRWVESRGGRIRDFVLSPDGGEVAFTLQSVNTQRLRAMRADALSLDRLRPLQPDDDTQDRTVGGYFDANEILLLRPDSSQTDVFDARTQTIVPFRDLPEEDRAVTVVPLGVVVSQNGSGRKTYFAPRDTARPIVALAPSVAEPGVAYETTLSPDRSRALIHRHTPLQETLTLVDFQNGTRRVLVDRPNDAFASPLLDGVGSVRELAFAWIAQRDEIAVVDGRARRLLRFNASGDVLDAFDLPPVGRTGPYALEPRDVFAHAFATVATRPRTPACLSIADEVRNERPAYDPATESLFVHLAEVVGMRHFEISEDYPLYLDGASQFVAAGFATRDTRLLSAGSPVPLQLPLDAANYPLLAAHCPDSRPPQWPELILRDGARLLPDGKIQSVSHGVSREAPLVQVEAVWPDENQLLSGTTIRTSLLNGYAVIDAQTTGAASVLSGVAADRNFAYYEIDYARVGAPDVWYALAPPTASEVLLDEFVTWVPPDPGDYLVRLRVVDRAGNATSAMTNVSSTQHPPIDSFVLSPRYFSPNGDGVLDQVDMRVRVREPVSLQLRVTDEAGAIVRTDEISYGAGDLGMQSLTWDGRNDGGTVVPDGRYRVTLGDFGGWVVVDTTAPQFFPVLTDAYDKEGLGTGTVVIKDDPLLAFNATDRSAMRTEVSAVPVSGGTAVTIHNGDGASSPVTISAATYANAALTVTVSDIAGNRATRSVARLPQRLVLATVEGLSFDLPQGDVPYETLPFDESRDIAMIPLGLSEERPDADLVVTVAASDVRAIGMQIRRSGDVGAAWTERSLAPPEYFSRCGAAGEYARRARITLTTQGLELGQQYQLRLVAERGDGSRITSNRIAVAHGGIGDGQCQYPVVSVTDFNAGTLRDAQMFVQGWPDAVPAMEITPDAAAFMLPAGVERASAHYFVATDANGRKHRSRTFRCLDDGNATQMLSEAMIGPVVDDRCDGTPSGRLRIRGSVQPGEGQSTGFPDVVRWRYVDGATLQEVTTTPLPLGPDHTLTFAQNTFELDVAGWPEGSYPVELQAGHATNGSFEWRRLLQRDAIVERLPPQVAIGKPRDGERICANAISTGLRGSIATSTTMSYRVSIGQGASPASWWCLREVGAGRPDSTCRSYGDLLTVARASVADQSLLGDSSLAIQLKPFNGIASFQLKAVNWSGGTVCAVSTGYVDADAEFVQREPPSRTISRLGGLAIGLAPNTTDYARARLRLRADEPLEVTTKVYNLDTGEMVGTLGVIARVTGNVDIDWDGRVDGVMQADGDYGLDVEGTDDCGQTRILSYVVVLKNTPPAVAFAVPAPNATIASAVVNVHGTVVDPRLARWTLDVATPASPDAWMPVANGITVQPEENGVAPELAAWSRGQLTGPVTFRLSATDQFGNAASTTLPVVLGAPTGLLASAAVAPALFSPNADGVLDATRVEVGLLRAANLAIRVHDTGGAVVATLYDGAAGTGARGYPWDGAAPPDGDYAVVVDATDPSGSLAPEQARLSVTIDRAAPAIALAAPITGFIRPAQIVRFTVDDPHLVAVDATLTRGGSSVASIAANNGGALSIAVPADAVEGAYALRVVARDGAGNRRERTFDFVLDRTAPLVAFAAPAERAVIASASPTAVRGSVGDDNLATYTLSVAPAAGDDWQTLASGTAAFDTADILAWTPNRADGEWRLRLTAEDRAGNVAQAVRTVVVDGTPPVATIALPADGAFVTRAFDLVGSATDANFAEYRIAVIRASALPGATWSDVFVGTMPVDAARLAALDLPLAADDYIVRLSVKDRAGLVATDEARVRIDAEPPPAPLALVGRVEDNRHARLAWNAVTAPDLAGYHVLRGGTRITAAPVAGAQYTDADAPEGTLRYEVVAVDTAGNESAPSNAVMLDVDHTAPAVAIARPADGERVRGLVDIVGTAYSRDDFRDYRVTLEPLAPAGAPRQLARSTLAVQAATLAQWNTTDTPDETRVRLRLDAADRNGNAASASVELVVDNLPPAAPTGVAAALATAPGAPCAALGGDANDVRVCWNANVESDLLGYLVRRDGALLGAPDPAPADLRPFALADAARLDADIADGVHTYVVYAIDRAGNVSAPSEPVELAPIDFGPPTLTLQAPLPGTVFDRSVDALATSAHRDIAEVRFAFRAVGATAWTEFGAPLATAPYRATWTPGVLAYGDYDIRAVARDAAGNVDPAPPVVRVTYADLTPPDAPAALTARADSGDIALAWTPSTAADIAAYRIERYDSGFWQMLADVPAAPTAYDDANLASGEWRYRVYALDASGNRSPASNVASADVFGLVIAQPFTPVRDASVALAGRSPRTGVLSVRVETVQGALDLAPATLDAQGTIALTHALVAGANRFTLRVTDANGNRSRAADVRVDRGDTPAAPTGLAVGVAGYDVTASWNANAEPDVIGYRVFRRGGAAPPDAAIGETPAASATLGWAPEAAVDGDPQTAFLIDYTYDIVPHYDDPALELALSAPRLVVAANLAWASPRAAAGNVDLQAWSGEAWITVATARGAPAAERSLVLAAPYRTDRLRLVVHGSGVAGQHAFALAEIVLVERPLVATTSITDTLVDGRYDYRVSAVNAYGFESARSDPAVADVGDATPPEPVTLAGALAGNAAQLSWSASASADVARYELVRDGTRIATVAAASLREWTDAGLANGTHTWIVVALDAHDNAGAPSNTVTLTVAGSGPGVPVDVRVAAPAPGGMLDVAWNAGDGNAPVAYVVRRAAAAAGPFVEISRVSAATFRDAPLANGMTVWYTVEAVDAFGNASAPSAPVSGMPRDRQPPVQPVLTYPTVAGAVLTTGATSTLVCGFAEPGSVVAVGRDGVAVAETEAAATLAETTVALVANLGYTLVPAPDGVHLAALAAVGDLRVDDLRDGSGVTLSSTAMLPSWSARGNALYYVDSATGAVVRHEQEGASRSFGIVLANVIAYAIDADEARIAFVGDYATDGAPQYGVWLARVDGTQARFVADVDANLFSNDGGLAFSPDGTRLLVAMRDEIVVVDTAAAAVIARHAALGDVAPSWSPEGRYAYAAAADGDGVDVRVVDAAGVATTLVNLPPISARQLAFSPDGSRLAVTGANFGDLLDASDGRSTLAAPIAVPDSDLVWTASGRLVVTSLYLRTARTIVPPGAFCTGAISLVATRHVFDATARDASGNASLPAAAIEVLRAAATLPDLAIGAADILFVPVDARPGDAVAALVTLRNAGGARAAASAIGAQLVAPDGTTRALAVPNVPPLAAGAAHAFSLDLGALGAAGNWRLRITVDAQQQLAESNENNNHAEAQLAVVADAAPQLDVQADRGLYAPGEAVTGEVVVTGTIAGARVRVAAIDAAGAVVDELGDYAVATLTRGQRWTQTVHWNAAGVFAGDYRLRARLVGANGSTLAERTGAFAIARVQHVALTVAPETSAATVGGLLRVRSEVAFGDGNAPIDGARLVLVALAPGGAEIALADQPLGTLLPGYEIHKDDWWNTAGLAPGAYGLRLRLVAPDYATLAESSVMLDAAAPTIALAGTLALAPAESVAAGFGGDLRYALTNRGDVALAGVVARVRVAVAGSATHVVQAQQTFDLAPGANGAGVLSLAAPPLALVPHGAILEARLPGDAPDAWRVLARLGFGVVDALPPEIVVLSPASAVAQPALVALRASIVDRHSTVAQAQFRVDGGAWQPLGLGAAGYYVRGVDGLADGTHRIVVRARDAWGNEATSDEQTFDVDATAPAITIDGIADGDALSRVVTPTIAIVEAHPGIDDVRLNGAPYVSGTPIDADGDYVLAVRSTDAAGNVAQRNVRFTIDRIAPTVAIAQPADGAVVSQSTVSVIVQTEANATATLTAGAWQAQQTADAAGTATFAAVPLALGDNAIAATARDRAGNVGGPANVSVRYETQSAALVGTVQPGTAELAHGTPLAVTLTAHNPGATALSAQRLRVRVETATAQLAEEIVVRDFAAGETFTTDRTFASDAWPLGVVTVTLAVERSGAWTVLDAETVDVVDRTQPVLTALAPAADAVLRTPVTLRAAASDALSGVASVEARIDGAAWIALAATATPGEYASTPLVLAEGDRAVDLRATDGAGNVRTLAPIAFAVDDTAPSIAMAGVADGDLVAHAVTPTVTVTDAHPGTTTITLNGAAFVSGTPVAASGEYVLRVESTDAAGNAAQAQIAFAIDREAPVVVITAPVDGATVNTATVAIGGTTEPLAKVDIAIGTFAATVFADASGAFGVAAANLAAGANTITATATDRAGNVGAPASIVVTYVPVVSLVTGEFGAIAPIVLRGAPLNAPYTVRNPGASAVDGVPVRVRLFAAGASDPAASHETTVSLAAQAAQALDATFDTATLDGGDYRLRLEALQAASGGTPAWTLLAEAPAHIYAPCAIRVPADRFFANGFDLVDHIFCDGFDFAATATASRRSSPDTVPWLAYARYVFAAPLAHRYAGVLR